MKSLGKITLIIAATMGIGCQSIENTLKDTKLTATTTFASDYVGRPGFINGSGPVNQTYLEAKKSFLSLGAWANTDLTDKQVHEVDGYLTGHISLIDGLDGFTRLHYWSFPSRLLGDDQHAVEIGIGYSGKMSAKLTATHVNTEGLKCDRNSVDASIGFPIKNDEITIEPSVRSSYQNNYFGTHGFSHVTPSVSIGTTVSEVLITGFAEYQYGLRNFEDNACVGFTVGWTR